MLTRRIIYSPKFEAELKSLDKADQERVNKAVDKLQEKPELGKPLRGDLHNYRTERVGHLRIIYEYDEQTLNLYYCRDRKDGY